MFKYIKYCLYLNVCDEVLLLHNKPVELVLQSCHSFDHGSKTNWIVIFLFHITWIVSGHKSSRCCLTWLLSWWTVPLSPAAVAQGFCPLSAAERSPPSCRRSRCRFRFGWSLIVFNCIVLFTLHWNNCDYERRATISLRYTWVEVVICEISGSVCK